MTDFSKRKASEQLNTEANRVRQDDVGDLLSRRQAIEEKVRNSGKLRRFSTDIRLMFSMLQDYWQGNYREVPWKSIAAIAGALIYVLNPLDLIPDLLLGVGFLDDAGVVAACLAWVESDLLRYAAWKEQSEQATTMVQDDQ
ncbi:YkvA family protein [Marinobacter sp. 71-i]|uniref:YkvA family protein n=1 Tax=Marinobacter iranensis TaxID=2962607 RepID=A0ABT5YB78_9GAMM|nr:YkvA family protein [Marinobacter iranensis]MDF0750909.1 YkvA family protein [Marinobacter iranensis]